MLQTLLNPNEKKILTWIENKKFKSSDFSFLNILKTEAEKNILSEVFNQCFTLNTSFSDTLHILELATELTAMKTQSSVLQNSHETTLWKNSLKILRYPQTTAADEELKIKLEALPWPLHSKIKFERRGDRAGVELKLFITSSADLTKLISALERVKENL